MIYEKLCQHSEMLTAHFKVTFNKNLIITVTVNIQNAIQPQYYQRYL